MNIQNNYRFPLFALNMQYKGTNVRLSIKNMRTLNSSYLYC